MTGSVVQYRKDIDGLRAIAVLSVIFFHSGIHVFSGGFIGVDIFFVISGYLITTLIYKEIKAKEFTFSGFYKRRAARILPALSLTLLTALVFGFIFYNNRAFDNLGKEIFFSSFGAVNILFSQGINYFAHDEAYQPLIHLWSLGVEEQFYVIWPVLLLLTFRLPFNVLISIILGILSLSLWLSVSAVELNLTKGYFLLQYRAFELLIGAGTSLMLSGTRLPRLSDQNRQTLSFIGLLLILMPMFLLDKESDFPGVNALWPCLGTAMLIAFHNGGLLTRILSHRILVGIGLISYPLYLYHQPVISFMRFFQIDLTAIEIFLVAAGLSIPLSWLTYKYIESPVRKMAHVKNSRQATVVIVCLTATIPFFALTGITIAKNGGLEGRFRLLNPFALEISKAGATTFHQQFERGYRVSPLDHGRILFIGDSVLQQYVLPLSAALDIKNGDIDTVTRGGCVLLKNVDFTDIFSDISCEDIREKLYDSQKTYDYVIISQEWTSYDSAITNFPENTAGFEKWVPFLDATIDHFSPLAEKIIIIGGHPSVDGTLKLQPSVTARKDTYLSCLEDLTILNVDELKASVSFFEQYRKKRNIDIINPFDIFCHQDCTTHDGKWSYFSDRQHISAVSTDFVVERLKSLTDGKSVSTPLTQEHQKP